MPGINASRSHSQQEKSRQRLQRVLRSLPSEPCSPLVDNSVAPHSPHIDDEETIVGQSVPQVQRDANAVQDVQYQCTSCDMMVGSSDSYCPFCGAIFADGPLSSEADVATEDDASALVEREHTGVPVRFDVLSLAKPQVKSREILYAEAMHGFAGSARLLEEIELMITEVSAIGCETKRARRLMSDAWEACREGDWPLVSALARQTEDLVTPSIPDLVRAELAKARNLVVEAKMNGVESSKYIVMMKAAMGALHREDLDEALRVTKQLMDLLREDASYFSNTTPST
ncbi:MAG: hypothetical protein JSV94_03040 [Methanobacteriota archaeon]|nr:MAG: hypothetical protein JSV94_03040 [Euryarchaeota archaeon]